MVNTSNHIYENQLKNYQSWLHKAAAILPYNHDPTLFDVTLHIITTINQYQIAELFTELIKLITIKPLRNVIIASLGFWLQVPSFKLQAYQIFLEDLDLEVKFTALMAWTSYYYHSKNAIILTKLYKILLAPNYPFTIRKLAFTSILWIRGFCYNNNNLNLINLLPLKSAKNFFKPINWQIITNIMNNYTTMDLKC